MMSHGSLRVHYVYSLHVIPVSTLLVPKEVPRTVGKSENTGIMATGGTDDFECTYSDSEPEQRFV